MPVLPELEPLLARINAARSEGVDETVPLVQRREFIHRAMDQRAASVATAAPDVDRSDRSVPVGGGEIVVRVYRPLGSAVSRPGHVYVHGGGWWLGTLDHRDRVCASRAVNVDCVVVSVAHRLAPEHRYPVPVEDVYQALQWVVANAPELGLDASRVSIRRRLLRREPGRCSRLDEPGPGRAGTGGPGPGDPCTGSDHESAVD